MAPTWYNDGVILEMSVARMPYEQFAQFLEERNGNYFQGLHYRVPNLELEKGFVEN